MSILAVDLAMTSWAAYCGDGGRSAFVPSAERPAYSSVNREFSALEYATESEAVRAITNPFQPLGAMEDDPIPEALVIEDLPHGVAFDKIAKAVARMQGRIIQQMTDYGVVDRLLFVQPVVWQSALGVWRKTPPETRAVAAGLGYTPPDLITSHEHMFGALKGQARQKIRNRLKKIETDYVDSFLLYAWAVQKKAAGELWTDNKGVQHYLR